MSEKFFSENKQIVSKTDLKGNITYCNDLFIEMSGHSEAELIGKSHNIVRDGFMSKTIFKLLWDNLKNEKEVFAYVRNRAKNGDFYWVYANVTPSYDKSNRVIGYHSIRYSPEKEKVKIIEGIYRALSSAEKLLGISAAEKKLSEMSKGVNYEKFILNF